jgi:hypothetical protein
MDFALVCFLVVLVGAGYCAGLLHASYLLNR